MNFSNSLPSIGSRALRCILCGAVEYVTGRESAASSEDRATASYAQPPQDRPGLGTKWGEKRNQSRGNTALFARAPTDRSPSPKFFTTIAPESKRWPVRVSCGALAAASGRGRQPGFVALRDQSGRFLPGLMVGDRWFVVGEEGRRYSIVVRNQSDCRLEAVLSVDGLDVIDGRPASSASAATSSIRIANLAVEGFRRESRAVAAFRFSPVRESYAHEKYHQHAQRRGDRYRDFQRGGTSPWTDREIKSASPRRLRFLALRHPP